MAGGNLRHFSKVINMRLTIEGPIGKGKTTLINDLRKVGYTVNFIEVINPMNERSTENWQVNKFKSPYPPTNKR